MECYLRPFGFTGHCSPAPRPTPHAPRPTPHAPRPTPHAPRLTPHAPRPTPHAPRPTPHASRPTPVGVRRPAAPELGIHGQKAGAATGREKSEKRGVQAARNGPSLPPTPAGGPVAKAEMSTADRLGSREVVTRSCGCTCYDWSYDQDVTQCATTGTPPRRAARAIRRCEALGTT